MNDYYSKLWQMREEAHYNKMEQIMAVNRAIKYIECEEVLIPAPTGISEPRWRAMIKNVYLNGDPK